MKERARYHWGGWLGIAGAIGFLVVVALLHLAQPEYDGQRMPISALAHGPHGEWLVLAFSSLAISLFGVQWGMQGRDVTATPRVLLLVAAAATFVAGMVPLGTAGFLHVAAVTIASDSTVVTMYLLPPRAGQLRSMGLQIVSWSLAGCSVVSALSVHAGVPLGIAQRIGVGCALVWLFLISLRLLGPRIN